MALVFILVLEFFVASSAVCTELNTSASCAVEPGCYWTEKSSGSCRAPTTADCPAAPATCPSGPCDHVVASCQDSSVISCSSITDSSDCGDAGCSWEIPTTGSCFKAQCSYRGQCADEKMNNNACSENSACVVNLLTDEGCAKGAIEVGSCQSVITITGQCMESNGVCKQNPNFVPPACSGAADEDACDDIGWTCDYDSFCVAKSGTCPSGTVAPAACIAENGCSFFIDAPFCKSSSVPTDCSGVADVSQSGCASENAGCGFVAESCTVKKTEGFSSDNNSPCSDSQISNGYISTPIVGVCSAVNTDPGSSSLVVSAPLSLLLMLLAFLLQ